MPHGEVTPQLARTARYEQGLELLLQLALMLNHDLTQSLARDGLTMSRARVLWELRTHGPSVQRTLADALGVTARTMTGLIDGLVASGLVTREPHPTDRRATLVTFTPQGDARVAAMDRDQELFVQILFGGMPDAQLDCLIEGISDVVSRLQAHGVELPDVGAEADAPAAGR
jgi:DNA-binding MarR family transcriptional regulator